MGRASAVFRLWKSREASPRARVATWTSGFRRGGIGGAEAQAGPQSLFFPRPVQLVCHSPSRAQRPRFQRNVSGWAGGPRSAVTGVSRGRSVAWPRAVECEHRKCRLKGGENLHVTIYSSSATSCSPRLSEVVSEKWTLNDGGGRRAWPRPRAVRSCWGRGLGAQARGGFGLPSVLGGLGVCVQTCFWGVCGRAHLQSGIHCSHAFHLFVQSVFSPAPKEITNICRFDGSNGDNFCNLILCLENRACVLREGATRQVRKLVLGLSPPHFC